MITPANPNRVGWIAAAPQRPLCDVPWLGTSVVLSDGSVNFCCFSDAVVGNVNTASFEEVWDGKVMRHIRHELSEQRFPHECQSSSCPLYRGDQLHYLLDRMDGPNSFRATATHDPHAQLREQLAGSALLVSGGTGGGDPIRASLEFRFQGNRLSADLFVGVRHPDGVIRFLPNSETYAVPMLTGIALSEKESSMQLDLLPDGAGRFRAAGDYEICAALFERDSNPNLLSNCYWSASCTIAVGA
jgi:hypothetical protein